MLNQNIQAPAIAAALSAAGVLVAGYVYYKYQKNQLPTTWTRVGKLDNIFVYPVKSCAPISLDLAECTYLGLKQGWLRDRTVMIVDEMYNFVTARVYPELLLVQPTVKNSVLSLRHADMEPLYVNLAEVIELDNSVTAIVWSCNVDVLDCGEEASQWFSKLLNRSGIKFRLVYYCSEKSRILRNTAQFKYFDLKKNDTGALPDQTPYNLINKASVSDLSSRLPGLQVDHRRFRPNFTVSGAAEYDEDKWDYVKIGPNVFKVVMPCLRCVMTVIDPETGMRDQNSQPLEMLRSYRLVEDPEERKVSGKSPRMGLQMVLRSGPGGTIAVNEDVYVAYKK